jgi:hypothetical protein
MGDYICFSEFSRQFVDNIFGYKISLKKENANGTITCELDNFDESKITQEELNTEKITTSFDLMKNKNVISVLFVYPPNFSDLKMGNRINSFEFEKTFIKEINTALISSGLQMNNSGVFIQSKGFVNLSDETFQEFEDAARNIKLVCK